ncbi:hypothetical protein HDU91_003910, partial [Kappamyces sp. JEL0680]
MTTQLEADAALGIQMEPCVNFDPLATHFWQDDDFVYWTSIREQDHGPLPVYYRKASRLGSACACLDGSGGPEEVLLDLNLYFHFTCQYDHSVKCKADTAEPEYWSIGVFEVLPHSPYLAFSIDTTADEKFSLYIWDIATQKAVYGPIENTYYSARWFSDHDSLWIFYNLVDSDWGIPHSIGRAGPFPLGRSPANVSAAVVYTEQDGSLTTELDQTSDHEYLFIKIAGQVTSEYRLVTAAAPVGFQITTLQPRATGVYYEVTHNQGFFYMRTNSNSPNFKIVKFPVDDIQFQIEIVPASPSQYIERMEMLLDVLLI